MIFLLCDFLSDSILSSSLSSSAVDILLTGLYGSLFSYNEIKCDFLKEMSEIYHQFCESDYLSI